MIKLKSSLIFILFLLIIQVASKSSADDIAHCYNNVYALINIGSVKDEGVERKVLFSKAMLFNNFLTNSMNIPKRRIWIEDDLKVGIDSVTKNSMNCDLVIIYMIGHGGKVNFDDGRIKYSYYTKFDGKETYSTNTHFDGFLSKVIAKDIVLVMDFCRSGGFIDKQSPNRWYFTSCRADEYTVFNPKFDGKRDDLSLSFTSEFAAALDKAETWNDAFITAKKQVEKKSIQIRSRFETIKLGFKGMHPQQGTPQHFSSDSNLNLKCGQKDEWDYYKDGIHLVLKVQSSGDKSIDAENKQKIIRVIQNRLSRAAFFKTTVNMGPGQNIIIQTHKCVDKKRLIGLATNISFLDLKLLDEKIDIQYALKGHVPSDDIILYEVGIDPRLNQWVKKPLLLKKDSFLTGEHIKNIKTNPGNSRNGPYIEIRFDKVGRKILSEISKKNVGTRYAIIIDNKVYSVSVIEKAISNGNIRISNDIFYKEEVEDLAILLRSGAFPASVRLTHDLPLTEDIWIGLKK